MGHLFATPFDCRVLAFNSGPRHEFSRKSRSVSAKQCFGKIVRVKLGMSAYPGVPVRMVLQRKPTGKISR